MKQKLVVLVLALLLVGSFTTAAVAMTRGDDKDDRPGHSRAEKREKHEKQAKHEKAGRPDKADKAEKQAWKKYWQGLTPEQRAATMADLAQKHADGMKAWAACVQAANGDRAKRAQCERPLPPGLAKKKLR